MGVGGTGKIKGVHSVVHKLLALSQDQLSPGTQQDDFEVSISLLVFGLGPLPDT